jgi:hypothetical protein
MVFTSISGIVAVDGYGAEAKTRGEHIGSLPPQPKVLQAPHESIPSPSGSVYSCLVRPPSPCQPSLGYQQKSDAEAKQLVAWVLAQK